MVSQEQLYLLVAIQGGSDITGYRVLLDEGGLPSPDNSYPGYLFRTEQFWQVRFPVENEQIAAVVGKKAYGELVCMCSSSFFILKFCIFLTFILFCRTVSVGTR